jgi:hypothetical protein
MATAQRIRRKHRDIAAMFMAKHRSFGDSTLRPLGVFAGGDAETLLRVRIDDTLHRIRNAPDVFGEDAVKDATVQSPFMFLIEANDTWSRYFPFPLCLRSRRDPVSPCVAPKRSHN